ncbi:unnamed protein product [Closterium sp. NIES-54]
MARPAPFVSLALVVAAALALSCFLTAQGSASEVVDAAVASPTGGVIMAGSAASAAADAESSAGDEDEQRHWQRKLMGSFSHGRALQIIAADYCSGFH